MAKFNNQFVPIVFISVLVWTAGAKWTHADELLDIFLNSENKYKNVLVARVYSPDTIQIESGELIKLIGLRAPEIPRLVRKHDDEIRNEYGFIIKKYVDPVTSLEEEAFDFTKNLLEGKYVRLEFDSQKKSEKLQTLAYIFLKDGTLANSEILRWGHAYLQIQAPNVKYADSLRKAYRESREEKRGLQGTY